MAKSPFEHLYNTRRWRRRSTQHRQQYPFCAQCEREAAAEGTGRIVIERAVLCHHTIEFISDMAQGHFYTIPIEGLCFKHHQLMHGRNPPRQYDTEIDVSGWPKDPKHPANQQPAFKPRKAKP